MLFQNMARRLRLPNFFALLERRSLKQQNEEISQLLEPVRKQEKAAADATETYADIPVFETIAEEAYYLYETKQWIRLLELKKAKKKGWKALGFNEIEITIIEYKTNR